MIIFSLCSHSESLTQNRPTPIHSGPGGGFQTLTMCSHYAHTFCSHFGSSTQNFKTDRPPSIPVREGEAGRMSGGQLEGRGARQWSGPAEKKVGTQRSLQRRQPCKIQNLHNIRQNKTKRDAVHPSAPVERATRPS